MIIAMRIQFHFKWHAENSRLRFGIIQMVRRQLRIKSVIRAVGRSEATGIAIANSCRQSCSKVSQIDHEINRAYAVCSLATY